MDHLRAYRSEIFLFLTLLAAVCGLLFIIAEMGNTSATIEIYSDTSPIRRLPAGELPVTEGTTEQILDTSTWKTYRSEELHFEFSYPGEWNVSDDVGMERYYLSINPFYRTLQNYSEYEFDVISMEFPGTYTINGKTHGTYSERLRNNRKDLALKLTEVREDPVVIDGLSGILLTGIRVADNQEMKEAFISHDGRDRYFRYDSRYGDFEKVFDGILSTFRFISSTAPASSDEFPQLKPGEIELE